jgi:heme-degrading monooxygenase HmoA
MHARMARYTFTGDSQELSRRAEEGILPILQSMPGFKSYTIVESDGEILSFSAWESAEAAEATNAPVAQWVAENMVDEIELKETRIGEIRLSTALGVSTTTGITA